MSLSLVLLAFFLENQKKKKKKRCRLPLQEMDSEFSATVLCSLLAPKTPGGALTPCTFTTASRPQQNCRISHAESRSAPSRAGLPARTGQAVQAQQQCALTAAVPMREEGVVIFRVVNESRRQSRHRAWQLIPQKAHEFCPSCNLQLWSVIIFQYSRCAALSDRTYCLIFLQFS